ncbi:hypothetical protein HerbRD11066_40470 [Herbidospora sp. RD11066]
MKVADAAALAGLATKGITTKASASEKTAVSVRQRYLRCMSQPLWDGWGNRAVAASGDLTQWFRTSFSKVS